ncbi:MAG: hypothetical protein OXR07_08675, partial [Nitrospira sp.]|nr:hypothetical protein [Nitrospira sp.]
MIQVVYILKMIMEIKINLPTPLRFSMDTENRYHVFFPLPQRTVPPTAPLPVWLASALPPADAGHYGIASPPSGPSRRRLRFLSGSHRLS